MQDTHINTMANQISDFFKSYGEQEAVEGIAEHINKFWDPRMRKQFFAEIDKTNNSLNPLVVKAATLIKRPKTGV